MEKKCNKCNVVKNISEFSNTKLNRDGLNHLCIECAKENSKQKREANKYYLKELRQINKEKLNQFHKANKEKLKKKQKRLKEVRIEFEIKNKKEEKIIAKKNKIIEYREFTLTVKQIPKKQINTENIQLFKVNKKRCYKCKVIQNVNEFSKDKNKKNGLKESCKICINEFRKFSKLPEIEKKAIKDLENKKEQKRAIQREYIKKYRKDNKDKIKEQIKQYQSDNKEDIRNYKKKYKEVNKEITNIHAKSRWETDTLYRLKINIRRVVRKYLKGGKSKRTKEIIGINFKEFQAYLRVEYKENMHLDHIIPQNWAINEDEIYTLNHYSNFQIITAEENLSKSDRYCKSENLNKVTDNHNNLTKLNEIIKRNKDKIK